MKKIVVLFLVLFISLTSCSDKTGLNQEKIDGIKYENLYAPQDADYENGGLVGGSFTKFNFSSGEVTESETEWDIAFRGTTILVNGGAKYIFKDEPERTGNAAAYFSFNNTFNELKKINHEKFKQDSATKLAIPTGSGKGWYSYSFDENHKITALAGRVLVIRTADNKYAKMEVLSYYKDGVWAKGSYGRYYTFVYKYINKEDKF